MKQITIFLVIFTLTGIFHSTSAQNFSDPYIRNFSDQDFSSSRHTWAVIQDKRGVMYFGNSEGILEFDGASWRLIKLPNESGAYAFAKDLEDIIYVGGAGEMGYLAPDEAGRVRYVSLKKFLPEAEFDFSDRLVQAFSNGDLIGFLADKKLITYHPDANTCQVYTTQNHFFSAVANEKSVFVIDGARGLLELKDQELGPVPDGELLRSYTMLPIETGKTLIIHPQRGITLFEHPAQASKGKSPSSFSPWVTQNDPFFNQTDITSALKINSNCYVFGSIKKGLLVIDSAGRRIANINRDNGLNSNDIYDLSLDDKGDLWVCSDEGVSYLNISSESVAFASSQQDSSLGTGVDSSGTAKSRFVAIIRQFEGIKNDSLIFGGAFYEKVDGATILEQTEQLFREFPFDYNAFRFSFTSNYFTELEKTEYQCHLIGLDEDWLPWTNRNAKEYTNLYWGKYTFKVRARNFKGEISEVATYSFKILPPWYETWWYYTAQVAILVSLLVVSAFLNRAGKAVGLSNQLSNIVVIVVFKYVNMAIAPMIGLYSSGIALFKILMSLAVGLVLNPAQTFLNKTTARLIGVEVDQGDQASIETLNEETSRADRLGYSILLVTFKPPQKKIKAFRKWLKSPLKQLGIRDTDFSINWRNGDFMIGLVGFKGPDQKARFESVLTENNWPDIEFDFTLYHGQTRPAQGNQSVVAITSD